LGHAPYDSDRHRDWWKRTAIAAEILDGRGKNSQLPGLGHQVLRIFEKIIQK